MKILVLMPLDEQHVHAAAGIYKALPAEVQAHTFPMPMFMEYAITTKVSSNWTYAFFDAIISARSLYKSSQDKDLIIIGNVPTTCTFDAVFNFQEIDETLPYKDNFAARLKDIVATEEVLSNIINNLYTADSSIFSLQDCTATADFLTAYLQTDPQLDKIKAKYSERLQFKSEL